jgi:hypothetical protein
MFVIFRDRLQHLTEKYRYVVSAPGNNVGCLKPICNPGLGKCLKCFQTSNSSIRHLLVFDVTCMPRVRKEFRPYINRFATQQVQYIQIHGSNWESKGMLDAMDYRRDIFQIHWNTNKSGCRVYHVNMFTVEQ